MAYLNVVKREIKRFYKRPLIWTLSFFLPFTMCLLICLIFCKGSPTDLPIAVMDNDNSEISRMFVRNLEVLPSCHIKYNVSSLAEGRQLLTEGKVYAFFAIPKNFYRDMVRLKQPKLIYYYNNQRILIGGIITKDINTMVQTMMFGINAKVRTKYGLPMSEAIKQVNLINVTDHINSNPFFNYQYFLSLVAFGHILQIHLIVVIAWALGTEFKIGTSKDWLKCADNSIIIAFLGKITPYFVIFIILFSLLYLLYFGFMQVPYRGDWLIGIVSTILFMLSCFAISSIFISVNGNFRFGLSGAEFYCAMGFAFAGVTFPAMSMPILAKIYNGVLPLSYWVQVMIDQSLRQIPIFYDFKHLIALLILMLVGLVSLARIKVLAKDEKRWYQS